MRQFSVLTTKKALADMDAIYDYIAFELDAPLTAMRQYDRIAEGIESLKDFPLRNKLFDCQPEHDLGIRAHLVDNYSIIYTVKPGTVVVLRVLYSKSDIVTRLHENQ